MRQRILLHLQKFGSYDGSTVFSAPFDITQDGIATAAGVTRPHISIVLKQEVARGNVEFWNAHPNGGGCKRHVYGLTQKGRNEANDLIKELELAGIKVDDVLNTDRCDPSNWWKVLSDEDKDTFGKACVLRTPVKRDILPGTTAIEIPTDKNGMISIPRQVSDNYLSLAPAEKLTAWHCWAADLYRAGDNKDFEEIIHHLSGSGKMKEACRLAANHRDDILSSPCDRTYRDITDLTPESPNTVAVLSLKTELALETLRQSEAKEFASELMHYDRGRATTYLARAELLGKRADVAFKKLSENKGLDASPDYSITSAEVYLALGKIDKAIDLLNVAKDRVHRTGDRHDVDRTLMLKSMIAKAMGDDVAAAAHLISAGSTAASGRRKMILSSYRNLNEMLEEAADKEELSKPNSF